MPGCKPVMCLVLAAGVLLDGAPAPGALTLERLGEVELPGAEIVAPDPASARLAVTCFRGVAIVALDERGTPTIERIVDAASEAELPREMEGEISHVAFDPLGRGVAAACVIPRDRAGVQGRVVFFDAATGDALACLLVGFNPDSLCWTPDGARVCVANEGEPAVHAGGVLADPPGSISVIATAKCRSVHDFRKLRQRDAATVPLVGDAVDEALRSSDPRSLVRVHPARRSGPELDLEPECIGADAERAYVTFQENNAIGVFGFSTMRWSMLRALGAVERRVDASDRDGGPRVAAMVNAMPMPDQLAWFDAGGRRYLVTADEGDDRGDVGEHDRPLADQARLKHLARGGRLNAAVLGAIDTGDAALGRLNVCAFSGDLDADGLIDLPMMLGARSITVWDAATLARIGDSGSQLEDAIAARFPGEFNMDSVPGEHGAFAADSRSDDRGPEPEGVAIGEVAGVTYAFVSLERPGGIAAFDLRNPARPELAALEITAPSGGRAPEGLALIPARRSPTGSSLLAVAFEGSGRLAVYRVSEASEAGASR